MIYLVELLYNKLVKETNEMKIPEGIMKKQVDTVIQQLYQDYVKELIKEDANVAYKALTKSNSIKEEVINFILYSIVRGFTQMYDEKGISTETMSNDEFDIAYEEVKQNIYSYIRNNLEEPKVKCDYLPD